MKRRLALSLSGVLLLTFLAVVVAGPTLPDLEVQYDRENDLLSVRARQIPLDTLLQEIAQKAGLSVESRKDEFLREPVSVELKGLPLEQALTRLLREFNSAFLYSTGTTTPRLVKIVLISKKSSMPFEAQAPKDEPGTERASTEGTSGIDRPVSRADELIRAFVEKQSVVATAIIEELEKSGEEQQRAAREALLETLKDRDFPAHHDVIAALKKLSAGKAVDALTNWLQGDDPQISMRAAMALGRLGDERAVDALRLALTAKDPVTRQAAASSLAEIGGDRAIATLLEHLSHQNAEIRRPVIGAISKSDDVRAAEALASVVAHETDVEGRKLAAFYLVEREGARAIAPLTTALRDHDPRVRLFAVSFLGRLGEPAEPLLTEALKDAAPEVRATAASWLDSLHKRK